MYAFRSSRCAGGSWGTLSTTSTQRFPSVARSVSFPSFPPPSSGGPRRLDSSIGPEKATATARGRAAPPARRRCGRRWRSGCRGSGAWDGETGAGCRRGFRVWSAMDGESGVTHRRGRDAARWGSWLGKEPQNWEKGWG
jgi:hypothetical protein